jgi:hypothetical protein
MAAVPGALKVTAMRAMAFETVTQLRKQRDLESTADGSGSPQVVLRETVK